MASKNVKKRNWTAVVYPESAPADWMDVLVGQGLRFCVSPLHDRDVNPTGEPKKPHYHIVMCFDGPTTYSAVKALMDELRQPIPQPVQSVRGAYRYLTHKDNPDKFQYEEADIRCYGGFDPLDYIERTRSELVELKVKVLDIIRMYDIVEYADLIELLRDSEMLEELDTAMSNTILFRGYIQSRVHQVRDKKWHERMDALLKREQNAEDEALELDEEQPPTG